MSGWGVMASGVQGGNLRAPGYETVLVALLIAAIAAACVVVALYLARRRRRRRAVTGQWSAVTVMGELCPDGWQAQITLYGWGAPVPVDAPPSRVPLVELEWKQFAEDSRQVVVSRRVWAPTIERALEAMVDDRLTDVRLEEIERSVADGGESWGE